MSNPFARLAVIATVVWAAAVLSSPFVVPGKTLEAQGRADLHALQQSFGGRASERVRHFAARLQARHSLLLQDVRTWNHRPSASPPPFPPGIVAAEGVSTLGLAWRRGLLRQSELAITRLGIAATWLMALWPLMVAVLYEGIMHRHLRRARADRARPAAFRFAGLAVLGLLSAPVVLLTVPLPWPQDWTPGWALALSLALAIRVALD